MNHFNYFVKEDATAGHTIGTIAVGGKANYIAGCGTEQGYNQTTSSYLKGPIIRVGADGCFKRLYVGETELINEQRFEHQNEQNTFISKNDCYIDLMDSDFENKDTLFITGDQGATTIPYIYLNGDFNAMTGEWGDVNGCFIAKSLNLTGSESHMFPYHGQKIKNNNTTPEQPGDNTQDGNENPGENNPGTGTVTTNPKQNDSVKTGDDTHLFIYVLLELLAFVGIVSLRKKA